MEWIKVADRLPTKEDADHTGYVLAWHETDGAFVQGYKRIYRSGFTHWAKIEPPKESIS